MPVDDPLVQRLLEHGRPDQVDALHDLARTLIDDDLLTPDTLDLPGVPPAPNDAGRAATQSRNRQRLWRHRRRLYGDALPYEQAAELLQVSTNQISNLVTAGDLVALDGEDGRRLPAWQFHPDTPRGRLPGIRQVAAAHPGGVLALSSWMVATNQALGGRTPVDRLVHGDVDAVVAIAATGL